MTAAAEITGSKDKTLYYYKPGEPLTLIDEGSIHRFPPDYEWKDLAGYRSEHEVEEALTKWNTLEVICDGDHITVALNGAVVNEVAHCTLKQGKIAIQSLGSELFIRKMEIRPLPQETTPALAAGTRK